MSVLTTSSKKTPPLSSPTETDGVIESDLKEKLSREDTLSTLVTSIPDPFPSLQTLPSHYHVTRGQSTTEVCLFVFLSCHCHVLTVKIMRVY